MEPLVRAVSRFKTSAEAYRFIFLTAIAATHFVLWPVAVLVLVRFIPEDSQLPLDLPMPILAGLGLLAVLTMLASILAGAVLRIVTPTLGAWYATSTFAMIAICLTAGTAILRNVATTIDNLSKGDGTYLVMFVALWLYTVGYLAKIPWDDARDRLTKILDPAPHASPK